MLENKVELYRALATFVVEVDGLAADLMGLVKHVDQHGSTDDTEAAMDTIAKFISERFA